MDSVRRWLGVELGMTGWKEKAISAVGGAIAIMIVVGVSRDVLGSMGSATLIGSMGASAVLLFAVPHGALSQPWPTFGGHVISAIIGVSVAKILGGSTIAAAVAVGLAIGAMYQFRCIHPPGGATALSAVIGGQMVHDLGYEFVVRPVMINAFTILVIAVLFNALLPWRRYPAHASRRAVIPVDLPGAPSSEEIDVSHDEILMALRSLHSFVDITEADLRHLV